MQHQVKAQKILYLWDDIKRIDEFEYIKDNFNDVVSFDHDDCTKFKIRFLPLFYCDEYIYKGEDKDIDFSCLGVLHTYRESLLANLQQLFSKDKYRWYAILSTSKFHILKQRLLGKKLHDFVKYKELNISEAAKISKRSKIVIDMPHLSQKGMSMRTIESLAAHAKLITTNKEVCMYDFYNPNNMYVIDQDLLDISDDFLTSEFVEIDYKIIEKYSINHWVQTLFGEAGE